MFSKESLDFIQRLADRKNVENNYIFARVKIFEAGNPIPDIKDKHNKGHFVPKDPENFLRYASILLDFMRGPSMMPAITPWQTFIQDKLANKYYKSATVQEQFIAEVLETKRGGSDPTNEE